MKKPQPAPETVCAIEQCSHRFDQHAAGYCMESGCPCKAFVLPKATAAPETPPQASQNAPQTTEAPPPPHMDDKTIIAEQQAAIERLVGQLKAEISRNDSLRTEADGLIHQYREEVAGLKLEILNLKMAAKDSADKDFDATLKAALDNMEDGETQLPVSTTRKLPDGSMIVQVKIDADMVEILAEWALGASENLEEYVQRQVETSLTATVLGSNVG